MNSMSSKIVSVDRMSNGVLVNFADGARALFGAAFLYEQVDKRIKSPVKRAIRKRLSPRTPLHPAPARIRLRIKPQP